LKAPGSIVKIWIVCIFTLNEILPDPYVGNHFDAGSETVYDQHRAEYAAVDDQAALDAAKLLSLTEGIIPALESAHAIAGLIERLPQFKSSDLVILNLSGRGDKDMDTYKRLL